KPQTKYHARQIATGKWQYSTDLFSSKQFLPTVVAMPATHGASVVSIDDSDAKKIPGVIAVTHIPGMPDYLIPEAVAVTAETTGMKIEQVTYNLVPGGGAFGRHTHHDEIVMAAQISQRLGKPIKLQWMREEGIKHGRCRPVSIHHVKATVANGDVVSFEHRMACPEMDLRHGLGDVVSGYVTEYNNEGACQYFFTHTQKLPYKFGPTAITLKQRLLAKPTAAWRVVYSGQVGTINEIIVDELARLLGKDEFDFRMEHLDSDRHRAVLEKAAHEGQWGRKLPQGVAQGLGMHDEYKSIAAYLMEVYTRGR